MKPEDPEDMKMLSIVLHSMVGQNDVNGNGSPVAAVISLLDIIKLWVQRSPCLVVQLSSRVSFLPVPSACRCVITPASVFTLLKDFHSVVYFIPLFKMTSLGIAFLVSKRHPWGRVHVTMHVDTHLSHPSSGAVYFFSRAPSGYPCWQEADSTFCLTWHTAFQFFARLLSPTEGSSVVNYEMRLFQSF